MRRVAWLIGLLALTTVAATAGAAAAAAPTKPPVVQGVYTVSATYGKQAHPQTFSMTLYKNHTGTDHFGDTITWSVDGKSFTMVLDGGLWTYHGTKHLGGFDTAAKPGTLENVNGGTGTWYAVRIA
jgi:hypothetical protein